MNLRSLCLASLGAAVLPLSAAHAQGPSIQHKAVGCIVADRYPRLDACFAPSADVARGRVHFRAHGTPHWYFVDMKAEGPCHSGILPKPLKSTRKIDYYIDVVDKAFAEGRTPEHDPKVVSRNMECDMDMIMAAGMGSASIVLGVAAGAPPIPVGFDGAGIVAGPPSAAKSGPPEPEVSAGSGGGGGGGTAAAFLLGAAAAGGAAYYIIQKDDEGDELPVYDGEWRGTTSQGRSFGFTVAQNAVTRLDFVYTIGTSNTAVTVQRALSPPLPITGASFTFEEQGATVMGTFATETSASGNIQVIRTPVITWQATRR
jgi:hypothetical protein